VSIYTFGIKNSRKRNRTNRKANVQVIKKIYLKRRGNEVLSQCHALNFHSFGFKKLSGQFTEHLYQKHEKEANTRTIFAKQQFIQLYITEANTLVTTVTTESRQTT